MIEAVLRQYSFVATDRICNSNRIKNIIESCIVFRAKGVYGLPKMC
jgi:hypothetical protein